MIQSLLLLALASTPGPASPASGYPAASPTAAGGPRVYRATPSHAPLITHRSSPIVITFRPSAEVRDRVIRLGDIAAVEGEDTELVARLEAVEVGTAPLSGRSRTVSASYAQVRVRQIGLEKGRLVFGGAAFSTVSRPDQVIPASEIEKTAREAVEAAQPGVTAEVSYAVSDQRVPMGAVELKVQRAPSISGPSAVVPVQVRVEGRQEALVTVSLRLLRRAPAVVAVRDLPAGTVLTESDLRMEERPTVTGPMLLGELSEATGKQVAVPIRAGGTLTASMLRPPVLIKRGARVRLICRGPSFTATVTGEALQDGIAGQPVRVRNLTSLLEAVGLTVDAQTVEVPY